MQPNRGKHIQKYFYISISCKGTLFLSIITTLTMVTATVACAWINKFPHVLALMMHHKPQYLLHLLHLLVGAVLIR